MNFKTTSVLFGILIVILFLFGMTLALKHKDLDMGFVLPSISKNEKLGVDTVEIKYKDGKEYVFHLKDQQWYLKLPGYREGVRAVNSRVEDIIKEVRTARKSDEADVTRNLEKFGLANPEITVTLTKRSGWEASIYLGNVSPDNAYVYVNSSERKRDVLAVPKSQLNDLFIQDINDFRDRKLLTVNDNTAKLVNLDENRGGKKFHLKLVRSEGASWSFLEPRLGPANFEGDLKESLKPGAREIKGVKNLLDTIGAIFIQDYEPPGKIVITKDNTLLRIEVDSEGVVGNTKEILLIGPKVPPKDKEEGQYYARLESEESVVRVGANRIDPLLIVVEAPARLRSHDLTQLSQVKPDRIEVQTGTGLKEDFNLFKTDPMNWQVVTKTNRMKANPEAIGEQGLLAALEGKGQIKLFLDTTKTDTELGLDEKKPGPLGPGAVVKVFADSLETPKAKEDKEKDKAKLEVQPKDVKPVVTLTFAKKEGDTVTVKRVMADGGVSRFVAAASVLDKVTQGPLAYLDTTLPGYSTLDVAKFELKRDLPDDKVDFIVKSEKSKEGIQVDWILLQPKDLPNRPKADKSQVDEALSLLSNLKAKKWVEKADPKKLPYGLDNPAISVTIQLEKQVGEKAEPKPIIYKFGQEAKDKDKGSYYALIPGNGDLGDLVFLVDASIFDKMKNAELRDRSVLKFNTDKAKEVKVTVVAAGGKLRPIFKHGDKTWVNSGFEVNDFMPQKVDELLMKLSNLDAEKYVTFKAKGNEAAYELGDKAPLTIEILMDDKTQHTLTIGKELADKSGYYYARYSGMPEVVFTVSTAQFSPLLGSVSYFSRNK